MNSITLPLGKYLIRKEGGYPFVGCVLYSSSIETEESMDRTISVGSYVACGGLYDQLETTSVTEILEVNEGNTVVRFKTEEGVYTISVV